MNQKLLMHGSHRLVYRDVLPKGKLETDVDDVFFAGAMVQFNPAVPRCISSGCVFQTLYFNHTEM